MNRTSRYTIHRICAVLVMLASLAWLTVSLPYVNGAQMQLKANSSKASEKTPENQNPLTNTTEEKNETAPVSISEYLHEQEVSTTFSCALVNCYKCHSADVYYAFHPELISPPPKILS